MQLILEGSKWVDDGQLPHEKELLHFHSFLLTSLWNFSTSESTYATWRSGDWNQIAQTPDPDSMVIKAF